VESAVTMTLADDRELVRRMALQDQTAMNILYARHNVRVYRFVLRSTRVEATAEVVMNEVFLEAWRKADRFEGRSSVSTWLMAIAHNRAVSRLRKRSEAALDEGAMEELADCEDTPEVTVQKQSKAQAMRECLEKLSPDHRAIIDLVYYHDKSVAEAAEIVGIPENTVKTRMFHARKNLSELMRKAGIDRGWP
jgi:RNA polymerase sigma-70 factor (ECF subfamily)